MKKYLSPLLLGLLSFMALSAQEADTAKMKASEKVAWLGVAANATFDKNGKRSGVELAFVWSRSPASLAGLLEGDILKSFNEKPVKTPAKLVTFVQNSSPGDEVKIGYVREGKSLTTQIRLGEIDLNEFSDENDFDDEEKPPTIDPATLSAEEAKEIWTYLEDEMKLMLLDEGFSPEHIARVIKSISAGEAELRKPALAKKSKTE